MNWRTGVTQRIISSTAVAKWRSGSARSLAPLVGILHERQQAAGRRRAGRIVPGGGDQDVVGVRFVDRQRLAVDPGVGDDARDVVGRSARDVRRSTPSK